jgi:hypothetical protein
VHIAGSSGKLKMEVLSVPHITIKDCTEPGQTNAWVFRDLQV